MSINRTIRHQAALDYVGQGYRIIPCAPGEKVPLDKDWHGNALTTPEAVNAYFETHGDCNIAMCPDDMGWAVVDIDPGADPSKLELPATRTIKTPRGGQHLYYVGSVPPTVGKLAPHVDTRGQRSYVLIPPSVVNGACYEEADGRYPALLPASLEAGAAARNDTVGARTSELDSSTDISSATALLKSYARRGHVSVQGSGGNNTAYQVSAKLVRDFGLTGATAYQLMMEHWNDACVPPWTGEELGAIVHNALNYGQNEQAAFATRPASETFSHIDLAKFAVEEKKAEKPGEDLGRFRFLAGPEMTALLPPKWVLPDLLPEDGIVLVTASKGSFKTFLAMELGLSLPLGRSTWGTEPHSKRLTFYGAHEGIRSIQKNHRDAWCVENGIDPREDTGFYVAAGPHVSNEDETAKFVAGIDEVVQKKGRQPGLIVLDTYSQSMMGLNENDPGDVSKFLNFAQWMIRKWPGCCVLTLAHLGKDPTRGTRGSNALEAGVDTVIDLRRQAGSLMVDAQVRYQRSAQERTRPVCFRGKAVQGSLVFNTISNPEFAVEKAIYDQFDRHNVAAIIQGLGATSEDTARTTKVIAQTMTEKVQGESEPAYRTRIVANMKVLNQRAKSDLRALAAQKEGRGTILWFAPPDPTLTDPDGL